MRKIIDTGFLLDKLSTNTGNRGSFVFVFLFFSCFHLSVFVCSAYGAGVYCSPQASYCLGYTRGGKSLLVCAVLMGKRHTCNAVMLGVPLSAGYDSHTDPSGSAEWVLFDEASILPCFVLELP